ncbi:hypothetical protein E2C04_04495 [Nocardioides daphniae]|uniref:Polysaccharide chain length determinant N-terminal domain-containing protein n=1 Tax=Nocardioides daphniae TaxID=402297 RepID=A0A4P7UBH2_9ACTN|nr:hypothetical protein E2C04_04495 [Nocardioides daphniae]
MELKDYVRLLRNHWRGVLTIVVLCVALGALWTATRSPIYAANANGFVTTSTTDENTSLASVNDSLAKSKATSFLQIARSRAVAERVIDDLGLTESPASLVNSIEAIQPPDTVLLQITARASTPERAVELADAWVSSLAETVEEIQNPQGRGTAPLRIMPVEAADLPSSPVSPDPVRNLALSLLVGLLLGFGYAVLRGTFDRRLMNKREIEEKFSVSVVGQIPATDLLNRGNSGNAQLAVDADTRIIGQGPASEAFRKLRTNLTYMDVDNPPRIIVVSSPMPGDGKSTVSANLVAAIERSGQSGHPRRRRPAPPDGRSQPRPGRRRRPHRRAHRQDRYRGRAPAHPRPRRPPGPGGWPRAPEPERAARLAGHAQPARPPVAGLDRRDRRPAAAARHRRRDPRGPHRRRPDRDLLGQDQGPPPRERAGAPQPGGRQDPRRDRQPGPAEAQGPRLRHVRLLRRLRLLRVLRRLRLPDREEGVEGGHQGGPT